MCSDERKSRGSVQHGLVLGIQTGKNGGFFSKNRAIDSNERKFVSGDGE